MNDDDKEKIKPSGKKAPATDESSLSEISAQIVGIKADLARIREEVSELKKDKTPYGVIMNSPVIFVCGLFVGVLVMGYMLWTEKQERKDLKQDLIEYVDKMKEKTKACG